MEKITQREQEIDLLQLISLFWSKKWIFFVLLFICVSVGGVIAHSIKPIYQVEFRLLPPFNSDVAPFTFGRTPHTLLQPLKGGEVYQLFQGLLFSESKIKSFLGQIKKEMLEKNTGQLSEKEIELRKKETMKAWARIKIAPIQTTDSIHPLVQVTANNQSEAIDIGKKFISYIEDLSKKMVYDSLKKEVDSFAKFYQKEIDAGEISFVALDKEKINQMHLTLAKIEGLSLRDTPINRKKQYMVIFLSIMLGCLLAAGFILLRGPSSSIWTKPNSMNLGMSSND